MNNSFTVNRYLELKEKIEKSEIDIIKASRMGLIMLQ